jgi:hypothetical protein
MDIVATLGEIAAKLRADYSAAAVGRINRNSDVHTVLSRDQKLSYHGDRTKL